MKYWYILLILFTAAFPLGCRKFIDVPPPTTQLVGESVYNSNTTAVAAITGIYQTMSDNAIGGNTNGISALLGLSADEFSLYPNTNTIFNQAYSNSLSSSNNLKLWSQLYNCIYQANSAITGLSQTTFVTDSLKRRLMGEAKFIRALCNFYLVNIFGEIPLVTTTDYQLNSTLKRSSEAVVYTQIIDDLKEAQTQLSEDYVGPFGEQTTERVRPNRAAAAALLARAYLYQEKWDSAEIQSTIVISKLNYQLDADLNNVFLTSSQEAILQLQMPFNGFNAPDGAFLTGFIYYGGPQSSAPFILSDTLFKTFDSTDLRKLNWIGTATVGNKIYHYPYKYKLYYTGAPPTEYPLLLRLGEQYLIRSESRAKQNKLEESLADLNKIRARAGISIIHTSSQTELLSLIQRERRHELFTEYGHRWLDLKRTKMIDEVMKTVSPAKGGVWNNTDQLYPIPLPDILSNSNLIQNPGYN